MALLMFKCIYGLAPNYLSDEIVMEVEVANRLSWYVNENNVHVPECHLEITKYLFSCMGPTVWNELLDYVKECTSLSSFKGKAKKYCLKFL